MVMYRALHCPLPPTTVALRHVGLAEWNYSWWCPGTLKRLPVKGKPFKTPVWTEKWEQTRTKPMADSDIFLKRHGNGWKLHFRLPLRWKWDSDSSGMLRSEDWYFSTFWGDLWMPSSKIRLSSFEIFRNFGGDVQDSTHCGMQSVISDRPDRLYRNVGKWLEIYALWHPIEVKI